MKNRIYLTLALTFGATATLLAQAPPGFVPSVDDVTAPLPGLILAALVAVGIGVKRSLRK